MWEIEWEAMVWSCHVVIARSDQLQFDIDNDASRSQFAEFYVEHLYIRYGDKLPREHWTSKSGNDHWVVTLPESLSIEERIAMQTMGGSDPIREWASLCCHWDGQKDPILLYRPTPKRIGSGCPCQCHIEGMNPVYCQDCPCGEEWHDGGVSIPEPPYLPLRYVTDNIEQAWEARNGQDYDDHEPDTIDITNPSTGCTVRVLTYSGMLQMIKRFREERDSNDIPF